MIKAVIFDIGGGIIDLKPWFDRFAKVFKPKNTEKFWKDFNIKIIPLCKNKISEKTFLNKLAVSCGIPFHKVSSDILVKDFAKLANVNSDAMRIIKELKGKYKLALLSNMLTSHSIFVKKKIDYNYFDVVILSNEVGMAKDSKDIFLFAAKRLNVKPAECIFIDDIGKFVKVAQSLGMKAILYKNSCQLKKELENNLKIKL